MPINYKVGLVFCPTPETPATKRHVFPQWKLPTGHCLHTHHKCQPRDALSCLRPSIVLREMAPRVLLSDHRCRKAAGVTDIVDVGQESCKRGGIESCASRRYAVFTFRGHLFNEADDRRAQHRQSCRLPSVWPISIICSSPLVSQSGTVHFRTT